MEEPLKRHRHASSFAEASVYQRNHYENYDRYKHNMARRQKRIQILFELIVNLILYGLICGSEKSVKESGNEYSLRHYEYNELAFSLVVQVHAIRLVGIYTMHNFQIRIGVKCLDITLLLLLIVARTAMLVYGCVWILPPFWKFIKLTYWMNQENWWKSPDEPFITNGGTYASMLNAVISWYPWSIFRMYIFLFMYIVPIVILVTLLKSIFGR